MNSLDIKNKEQAYYYSCLYNSLVLFAAPPAYLSTLDGPGFDSLFEMESEFDYAFRHPVFDSVFTSGMVPESLRAELLLFKEEIDLLPNDLWEWEAVQTDNRWLLVRLKAHELLAKMGEARREYDFNFTNVFEI